MLPIALQIGLSVFDFWEMTLGEILISIKAYKSKKDFELKERAYMDYKLSMCISNSVARLFNEDNEPMSLLETYPELYKEEAEELEKEKIKNQLEIQKQNMIAFANSVNARKEVE